MLLPYRVKRLVAQNSESAVARGVVGAALVEFDGTEIAIAGMKHDELRPFVRSAVSRLRPDPGGIVSFTLDDHDLALGLRRVGSGSQKSTRKRWLLHLGARSAGPRSPSQPRGRHAAREAMKSKVGLLGRGGNYELELLQ